MRIIGHIDHPTMKITVFKMDNKLSVKFEMGLYEQTYKFRESDYMKDLKDVENLVDATFIGEVIVQFNRMHKNKNTGLERLAELDSANEFPEII